MALAPEGLLSPATAAVVALGMARPVVALVMAVALLSPDTVARPAAARLVVAAPVMVDLLSPDLAAAAAPGTAHLAAARLAVVPADGAHRAAVEVGQVTAVPPAGEEVPATAGLLAVEEVPAMAGLLAAEALLRPSSVAMVPDHHRRGEVIGSKEVVPLTRPRAARTTRRTASSWR